MAFTVTEAVEARTGSTGGGSRRFIVRHNGVGSDGEYDARVAVINQAPASIGTKPFLQWMKDIRVDEIASEFPTTYTASVDYVSVISTISGDSLESPPSTPTDQISFNFNASAQGHHIDVSLETVSATDDHGEVFSSPNELFGNAINVTPGKKEVKGLDLNPPEPTFEFVWTPANSKVSVAFRKGIVEAVGHTNSSPFNLMGEKYEKGELFLSYIRGGKRTSEDHEISIGFAYAPNLDSTSLGGIEVAKKGHEYIWAYSFKEHDPDEGLLLKVGVVFVERVWPEFDFNASQIAHISSLVPT
jgi:hypothetical protein